MSEIRDRYFVAEGSEVKAIVADMRKESEAYHAMCDDLAKKYGAECVFTSRAPGSAAKPRGLVFHTREDRRGFRYYENHAEKDENGEWRDLFLFLPDKRTKLGRTVEAEMEAIPGFTPSVYLVKRMGVARTVFGPGSFAVARAGIYANDTVVVVVPEKPDKPFAPPPFLREIKKSEFVAITEEQDEEEAA